jgi:hypothetical protein
MCSQNPTENIFNDKQNETSQQNNMKILALISTVLVTTHVAVAVDDAATPAQTPKVKKGKKDKTANNVRAQKQQTQSMVPLPAESRIVGGTFAQPGAPPFLFRATVAAVA